MLKQVVEVRLQWVVKARLNELLRVLSKPNTSPAISNHTIPLHCREPNFWLDATATSAGYVGFTGSHLGCILLHFKALLSYLPNLEPTLTLSAKTEYSLLEPRHWSMVSAITMDDANGLEILALEWTRRPMKNEPVHYRPNLHLRKLGRASPTGCEGQCDSILCSSLESLFLHLIESLETFPQAKTTKSNQQSGVSGVLMFLEF